MAAWLSFTSISHHNFFPHIPSICLSAVNSSPRPVMAPQVLKSSSQQAVFSRRPAFLPGVCMAAARTVWLSFHLGFHRLAVSLSALNSSPLTRTIALMWGSIGPLLQFPHPPRAGPILLRLLFFPLVPSSYRVLRGSIYYFPLVRYSCLLSAGILHALLCLKAYSWCIRGERHTPHPLTPPPSCSLLCCLSSHVSFIYLIPDMLEYVTITDTKATLHIAVTTEKSFTFWLWFHFGNPRAICWVRKSDVYPSANSIASEVWII